MFMNRRDIWFWIFALVQGITLWLLLAISDLPESNITAYVITLLIFSIIGIEYLIYSKK